MTSKNRKSSAKTTKPILLQVYPLVVTYAELKKLDWLVTDEIEAALAEKAMNLLVSALRP